jgi:hypothetical protein
MIKDGDVSGSASATASASPRSVASSVSDILKFQGHPLHAVGMGTVPPARPPPWWGPSGCCSR